MNLTRFKKLKRAIPFFLALWVLTACATTDKPFTLVGDSNAPQDDGGSGSGNVPPPTIEGCKVNYNGQMQLKVSADPTGHKEVEKLDARPIDIDPIPFVVDGNKITLHGDLFPDIILTRLSDSVDLRVSGIPGTKAEGTYDPSTGTIDIPGFQFNLEILNKGTLDRFAEGNEVISGVNFSTGSVTATGNLNPITEEGAPLDHSSLSISLVLGLTLPATFPKLTVLNNEIAGGALTARFDGSLDQLPENCVEGGGTPGGGSNGGAGKPTDFSIADGSSTNTGSVDFGTALVLTTENNGKTILDCTDALNRNPKSKLITLKNTSAADLKIKVMNPADTDADGNDPLCSGNSEFVRGTIKAHGAASCETVSVAGKLFSTTECTIPTGDDKSFLTFPLLYVPFNFVAPPPAAPIPTPTPAPTPTASGDATAGATPPAPPQAPLDTGALMIEYNDGKTFNLALIGRSEKDSSDSFRISKVTGGTIGAKEFRTNDVIKIPLANGDPKPFTQSLVLKNLGGDTWEDVTVAFPAEHSVYSVNNLASTTLSPANDAGPGTVQFDVVFNPGSGQAFSETMTITMVRAGSKTTDNPQGTVSTLNLTVNGTVGVPSLNGDIKFQVDFLSGKIDHAITAKPVESLDFRDHTDQAPPALDLSFADTAVETVKDVTLHVENKSVLDKSKEERGKSLRILNAQATFGTPGRKLVPGEGNDLCNEPNNISIPYDDSRMECSYFYFQISGDKPGRYDDDTGELTLPEITLRIENPYHSDIAGKWLPSKPGSNPSNILDTEMEISLTTLLLDDVQAGEGDEAVILVPDSRILKGDLSVKGKPMGDECPGDFPFIMNHDPSDGTLEEKHPHMRCYLTSDERYMKGRAVSIRPDDIKERDVVLVGVGRFPPGTDDPNLPWFMGEGGGSRIYIAIQGRLIVQ